MKSEMLSMIDDQYKSSYLKQLEEELNRNKEELSQLKKENANLKKEQLPQPRANTSDSP